MKSFRFRHVMFGLVMPMAAALSVSLDAVGEQSELEPDEAPALLVVDFDADRGTVLQDVPVKIAAGHSTTMDAAWSASFGQSQTDGRGVYRISRRPEGASNAYISLDGLRVEDAPIYVVTTISSYMLAGQKTYERMNIGLTQTPHKKSPKVVAQVVFDRNDASEIILSLMAFGNDSTTPKTVARLPETLDKPLTVVMKYDSARAIYEGSYRLGDGAWVWLGEGKTDPARTAWYLRLRASGSWSANGEYLDIDDIRLTRTDPRHQ